MDQVKDNCILAYNCPSCGQNCLHGKHISIQLGSNDLLKREILPEFPFQDGRSSINLKWSRAFNIILQKMRYSAVREVYLLDIPNFDWPSEMTPAERYFFNHALLNRLVIFREIRERIRGAMRREMAQLGRKYSNRYENPLKCTMIYFENENFLRNNIHLEYNSQVQRMHDIRHWYKIYWFLYKILYFWAYTKFSLKIVLKPVSNGCSLLNFSRSF